MAAENTPSPREDYWHWRDEVLQVMYWLASQGHDEQVELQLLERFLVVPAAQISPHLQTMLSEGYLTEAAGSENGEPAHLTRDSAAGNQPAYLLTPTGILEARKRYLDEFHPFQGGHDHSHCPPNSPCHAEEMPHE